MHSTMPDLAPAPQGRLGVLYGALAANRVLQVQLRFLSGFLGSRAENRENRALQARLRGQVLPRLAQALAVSREHSARVRQVGAQGSCLEAAWQLLWMRTGLGL